MGRVSPQRIVPAAGAAAAVGTVSKSHLGVDLIGGGFAALLPTLAARHSLSTSSVGLLVAFYSITALASQPLLGRVADGLGHAEVTAVMAAAASLFLAVTAVAPGAVTLIAALVVGGLAGGAFHPAGAALVRRSRPTDPTSAIAWFGAAGMVGLAIGCRHRAVGPDPRSADRHRNAVAADRRCEPRCPSVRLCGSSPRSGNPLTHDPRWTRRRS